MAYDVMVFTSRSVHPLAVTLRVKFDCRFSMSYHRSITVSRLPRMNPCDSCMFHISSLVFSVWSLYPRFENM